MLQPPLVTAETADLAELRAVLVTATEYGVPVGVKGCGHSSGGHTCVPGGILLSHRPEAERLQWQGTVVEVPAHWTWRRLERALHPLGRDIAVATSSVDTTIAGTLSMGGFGLRSTSFGAQVDHVCALRLR